MKLETNWQTQETHTGIPCVQYHLPTNTVLPIAVVTESSILDAGMVSHPRSSSNLYTNKKLQQLLIKNKTCAKLLRQHLKCVVNHLKILCQTSLKQSIDICVKVFPYVIHKTGNFLVERNLFLTETLLIKKSC